MFEDVTEIRQSKPSSGARSNTGTQNEPKTDLPQELKRLTDEFAQEAIIEKRLSQTMLEIIGDISVEGPQQPWLEWLLMHPVHSSDNITIVELNGVWSSKEAQDLRDLRDKRNARAQRIKGRIIAHADAKWVQETLNKYEKAIWEGIIKWTETNADTDNKGMNAIRAIYKLDGINSITTNHDIDNPGRQKWLDDLGGIIVNTTLEHTSVTDWFKYTGLDLEGFGVLHLLAGPYTKINSSVEVSKTVVLSGVNQQKWSDHVNNIKPLKMLEDFVFKTETMAATPDQPIRIRLGLQGSLIRVYKGLTEIKEEKEKAGTTSLFSSSGWTEMIDFIKHMISEECKHPGWALCSGRKPVL